MRSFAKDKWEDIDSFASAIDFSASNVASLFSCTVYPMVANFKATSSLFLF